MKTRASTDSRASGRLRRLLSLFALTLVIGAALTWSFARRAPSPERPARPFDSISFFDQLKTDMPRDEVYRLLGPPGDHRTDRDKEYAKLSPLVPFVKPDDSYLNAKSKLEHYALYDLAYEYWHWDDGSIGITFSNVGLAKKRLQLSDGPRSAIERACDPLRDVVYRHLDNHQYNLIWSTVILVVVVASAILLSVEIARNRLPRIWAGIIRKYRQRTI